MAAGIGSWAESGAWTASPVNGRFLVRPGATVSVSDPPLGSTRTTGLWGKNKTDFEPFLEEFRKSDYWGLTIDSTGNKYTIVRLWEHKYAGEFSGMPKRNDLDKRNTLAQYAARYTGAKADSTIAQNFGLISYPVFAKYAQASRGGYFAILTTSEKAVYDIGKSQVGSDAPSRPERGPGWDGTYPESGNDVPPATGSGSGTGSTTGVLPPGMFIPDLTGLLDGLNFPPSPSTNNPGNNPNTRPGTNPGGPPRTGGQYVTGPDGKRYWLPPNIDFEGLKREYDRRNPKPETKIVVRMPKGYAAPKVTNGSKPRMTQIQLDLTESGRAIGTVTKTFVFPYIPQNIRYSDIGSDWQEIPRALNAPLLDWNRYKLLKVSMDFLVSAQFKPGGPTQIDTVSDGLFNSVTGELNLLREMATNKFPVYLEGFDDILQVQMKRSRYEAPKGMQFVINDLNITAGRRTIDPNTGLATTPSLIAAAQVSMTLTEIPIETVTLVKLPPLDLGTPLVGKPGDGGGGGIPSLGLQSSTLTGLKWELAT